MKNKKVYGTLLGVGSLALIGNLVYRFTNGLEVGLMEITFTGFILSIFFFTVSWGSREKKDGVLPSEELGKKIESSSMIISYYVIVSIMSIGLIIDKVITGTVNISLMIILGLSLIVPAILTFFIAQTYQITPNIFGKVAESVKETYEGISKKTKNRFIGITGFLTSLFILSPLFGESRSFYHVLVYLFGEPDQDNFNPFPIIFTAALIALILYVGHQVEKASDEGEKNKN